MPSTLFLILGSAIVLSHCQMSSAQGQGGWGGNGASSWSSSSSSGQPGQPGRSEVSYGYGGVDANGVPYGGYGGNGGYNINVSDEQGRTHTYSGGPGAPGGYPGAPGGAPGQPGYPSTFSYASTNNQGRGYGNSSSSSFASASSSAWNTFYVIALFTLYAMIKF
uniref:Uncharacterized protein n=1 Tax=Stomoxys calcitrans TaxID=35570 RepID=A0A1I8PIJ2_STOCA